MKRTLAMATGAVFTAAGCALLVAALLAGCGGKTEGDADHAQVAEHAERAAGEMAGDVSDAISSYKTKWDGTLKLLETGFQQVKEAAGKLDDSSLDEMVGKIGTGLKDARSMLDGMTAGAGENLDRQKEAFESKVGDVKNTLATARSKVKEMMPDFEKMSAGKADLQKP